MIFVKDTPENSGVDIIMRKHLFEKSAVRPIKFRPLGLQKKDLRRISSNKYITFKAGNKNVTFLQAKGGYLVCVEGDVFTAEEVNIFAEIGSPFYEIYCTERNDDIFKSRMELFKDADQSYQGVLYLDAVAKAFFDKYGERFFIMGPQKPVDVANLKVEIDLQNHTVFTGTIYNQFEVDITGIIPPQKLSTKCG